MLLNNDLNKNKNFPLIANQFQNNTSHIINFYINLSENLNMNNNSNNVLVHENPKNGNNIIPHPINNILTNETFFNTFINLRSFLSMLQIQSAYQQYSQLLNNINISKEKEKTLIQKDFVGNKRNRVIIENKNNKNINKTSKNNKLNIIKEKNVSKVENKKMSFGGNNSNKASKLINGNSINSISAKENKLVFEKEFKNEEMELKRCKKDNKNAHYSKKGIKTKRYKELLQDTILENLDRPKKKFSIIINNSKFEKASNNQKNKSINKRKKTKVLKGLNNNSILKKSNSVIDKVNKSNKLQNKVYKFNFDKNKNSKNNYGKYQSTECIFHGDKYEKTKSPKDFMKYNYNYIEEIKPKNTTEKKAKKAVDLQKMINLNNYENNNYNLSDIKPIWLRSKFKGDDSELRKCTNFIKQKYKEGRIEEDEEKCLEKLTGNSTKFN